jgi:GNAT superfamily N-acetyltransferase
VVQLDVREEPADGAAARALLEGFAAEIAALYPGWTPVSGPSAAPTDFAPPGGCFVVAYVDSDPAGCAGMKRLGEGAAEIKRVYVAPAARRRGIARALLTRLEQVAVARGLATLRLDTGDRQPAALGLFIELGYRQIGDYNGNPYATHWLEKRLGPDVA